MAITNANFLVFQTIGLSSYPTVNITAEVRKYEDMQIVNPAEGYNYAYFRKTLKDFRKYDEKTAAAFMAFMAMNFDIATNVAPPKEKDELRNYFAIMYILPDTEYTINANIIEAKDVNQCRALVHNECLKDNTLKEDNFVILFVDSQTHENMQYFLPEYKTYQYSIMKQNMPQASAQPILVNDIFNVVLGVNVIKEEPAQPKVLETEDEAMVQDTAELQEPPKTNETVEVKPDEEIPAEELKEDPTTKQEPVKTEEVDNNSDQKTEYRRPKNG